MLNAMGAGKKNLLVNETVDAKFVKSAGNIAGVKTTFAGSVNTYDVLNADKPVSYTHLVVPCAESSRQPRCGHEPR